MGVRFAAKDGTRKSSDYTGRNVARFGHAPDTTKDGYEIGNPPSLLEPAVKRGRPRGERPGEEIVLLQLCSVPQCGTPKASRNREFMSTKNYIRKVNIS